MTVQPMTLFVYSDNYKTNLVATVRVEIHARPVIYTRARIGMQSQHTLSIPVGGNMNKEVRIFSNKPANVF